MALQVHQGLLCRVHCNAVQPRVELGIPPELMQGAPGANEGFLGDVLDQVHVAHHAGDQSFDAPLVLDDQQLKSALITCHRAFHQHQVAVRGGRFRVGKPGFTHG